jgi:hypothetical protein
MENSQMSDNSLVSLDRGPSPIALLRQRHSSLLDNARKGMPVSFGVLGYKGKNFRVKYRGEQAILKDDRGPVPHVDVVIVGVSGAISRQYFGRAYSDGDDQGPECWSTDGERPDAAVQHKQNPVCATCKWSQWGSRMTDSGKKAKVCQDTRRVAVVPLDDIENKTFGGPMLLRLPPMSIPNLQKYAEFLAHKGASFETVATRISFDNDMAYPRLTFSAQGFLNEAQQELVTGKDGNSGICASPHINRVLYASDVPPVEEPYGPPMPPVEEPAAPAAEPPAEEVDEEEEKPAANPFRAAPADRPKRGRKPAAVELVQPASAGMERALNSLFGSKKP